MNFYKKMLPGVLPSAALAASVLMSGFSGQALADCERGALDALYCDENGDMVADLPTDKSQWSNPDTLIFAYTPVEDPAIYSDIWQPFIDHLSEVTGRDVRFFAVQSNAAQV
ncbi:MAG TPA: phosphate/phosphite/phosphonate ABC transporter substrate-binding protein, partial [Marinobacter sp.]|nr:phosphate/phosphite/phosphonate ABC transporter substrate-binding protein [Marinobacter sp.]